MGTKTQPGELTPTQRDVLRYVFGASGQSAGYAACPVQVAGHATIAWTASARALVRKGLLREEYRTATFTCTDKGVDVARREFQ